MGDSCVFSSLLLTPQKRKPSHVAMVFQLVIFLNITKLDDGHFSTRSVYICSFGSTTPANQVGYGPKCETQKYHTSLDMTVRTLYTHFCLFENRYPTFQWIIILFPIGTMVTTCFFLPHFQTYPNIILLLGDLEIALVTNGYHSLVILDTPWIAR